jgi:TPP-dependent pyruvate/acetoin dehydrogenase alpha subunit
MDAALYRELYRIRRVEEEIARIYPTDAIKSPVHLSIGQEAVSVGVCSALERADVVFGTYRGHALYLAKGGDLKRLFAELFGKATGCAGGKGGSMHLIDVAHGVMGASAVVGSTIPLAVGYAYALCVKKQSAIVASFFGDGAVEQGAFHESLNVAALKRLPVLFVCENNQYAIHSPLQARQPPVGIAARAESYGIPAVRVDEGNDVTAIALAARTAVAAIRSGSGPRFLECLTYRWKQHVGPNDDFEAGYRPREEAEPWFASDWTRTIGARLDAATRDGIAAEIEAEIQGAIEFAESSRFPEPDDLYTDMPAES